MARRFIRPTESDIPMHGWRPYHDIHRERIRAHHKHDDNGQSMERKVWDDNAWLSVLVEEVGEVARVLCEERHGTYNNIQTEAMKTLREELVQTAAMTVAWIEAIDLDTGKTS
jgi:NTP pyrophosphatase (non-canonical NTP hydrolase)